MPSRPTLLAVLLFVALPLRAADATNAPPKIDIKSQSATYQFLTGTAIFSGGVTVLDPDVRMTCQTLQASFAKKPNKKDSKAKTNPAKSTARIASGDDIDRIEAIGSVVITSLSKESKGIVGRADRAIYTAADRKIVMLGNLGNRPNITRPNGERTTADKFIYDIEAGSFTGEGDAVTSFTRSLFNTSTQPPK